jgi:hypothetical protein
MKHKRLALLLALLILLGVAGGAFGMTSDQYRILWNAQSTGGGSPTGSTNYEASYTVGQTATMSSSGSGLNVDMGYWQGANVNEAYLPTMLNSATE